jgi:queuine tRNA-ribosyltransferase
VFSLSDLRTVNAEHVVFRSHLDGSTHVFTPESVVGIQRALGSDVMMVLDECTPFPCDEEYARRSNEITIEWARRSKAEFERSEKEYGHTQLLFGIVQGSVYDHIREASARALIDIGFDGYAIGGLAVGEPAEEMYRIVDLVAPMLPPQAPRYLMGVGTPVNLLEAVERGIDMFDCVLPTRNGRNATLFTRSGSLNIKNATFKTDFRPVDEECPCYTCRQFTRAYLRHLFQAKEILALQLATIHNLSYYISLLREARGAILEHRFRQWKVETIRQMYS